MRKTRSLHLEEDIWNEIDEYKDKYNLSSRNAAVERMLLERRMLFMIHSTNNIDNNNIIAEKKDNKPNNELDSESDKSNINPVIRNSIMGSYNNMPE